MVLVFGNKGLENYAQYLATRFTYSHTPEQEDPSSSISSHLTLTRQAVQDTVAGMWGADGSGGDVTVGMVITC